MRATVLAFLSVACVTAALAGSEFGVNTRQDSTQSDPSVASDGQGNYVVVWVSQDHVAPGSKGDICLQRFDSSDAPVGGETVVNSVTVHDQCKPVVAMNPRGDFVVVWSSFTNPDSIYDIKARLFRSGLPVGEEFSVNTVQVHSQSHPTVAMDTSGAFVVVWDSWFQDGGDRGIYGQRFNADGDKVGTEFLVNQTVAFSQARPALALRNDGGFVVVWESWEQESPDPSGYGVFGRLYGPGGLPETAEFQVNSTTVDYQWYPDVEVFDDSSFAVVWCSWEQDGSDGTILLRRFSAVAEDLGAEIVVNATTPQYQWLPRIRKMADGRFAVVWSSWKQDGSREGVYAQLFDSDGRKTSFETRVNQVTEGFQWEPDFVVSPAGEILAVWSSWVQTGKDYDIVARRLIPESPQGFLDPRATSHPGGRSTTRIVVHVVDSLALTGHTYEVTFDSISGGTAQLSVRDTVAGTTPVSGFPIDKGKGVFYLTPTFDGVAVETIPEFTLDLDFAGFRTAHPSGTNLQFGLTLPTAGSKLVAPIDAALLWGSTDTLSDGSYLTPLDTAIGVTGQPTIAIPFLGWNLTDDEQMEMLVVEGSPNGRWDPGERIVFRTPQQYRQQVTNTHAEITTALPAGEYLPPDAGDTNFVPTTRPLLAEDRYLFTTASSAVVDVEEMPDEAGGFALFPNYPNPFNPATTITYAVPRPGRVELRVYDVLGRVVATLVDEVQVRGRYRVAFDGTDLASGVYFTRLKFSSRILTRKMLLVK
jgi:hypothetical protein